MSCTVQSIPFRRVTGKAVPWDAGTPASRRAHRGPHRCPGRYMSRRWRWDAGAPLTRAARGDGGGFVARRVRLWHRTVQDGVCAAVRIPRSPRGLPDERKYSMKALCIAALAASFALPLAAVAQQDQTTTTTTQTTETTNHPDMRGQKKAHKQEKKAANDRLKARKEHNKAVNHDNKAADATGQPQ
jgi:hypothetical protein